MEEKNKMQLEKKNKRAGCLGMVLIGMAIAIVAYTCGSSSDTSIREVQKDWKKYEVITNAHYYEWQNASHEIKLATCGELLARYMVNNYQVFSSDNEWKSYSENMIGCIDTLYGKDGFKEKTVTEVAAGCLVLAGVKSK